jgi:hypothetical protein
LDDLARSVSFNLASRRLPRTTVLSLDEEARLSACEWHEGQR